MRERVAKQGDRADAIALLNDEIERLHAEKNEAQRQEHMAKNSEAKMRVALDGRLPYQPYVRTSYTIWVCPECGGWTDGAGYDDGDFPPCSIEHEPRQRVQVELVPKSMLVDSTDIQSAARDGIYAALKVTKQELRNVRAGVWAALTYLDRKEDGMVGIQLRSCLPDGYLPVGMGGDPDIAASTAQTRTDLKAEIARLSEALWSCMEHAGADTSYADNADHAYRLGSLPESAVESVKQLRKDYDNEDVVVGSNRVLRETLKLAYSCLLEVRRDFDAPINNVIEECKAVLTGEKS